MTIPSDAIELVVSDIDGTLVTSDKRLTEGAIRAATQLHEAGIALSLVSSRPPAGFAMLTAPLRIKHPLGAFNGGMLLNPDLSVFEEVLVPAEAARVALEAFAEFAVDAWVFTRDAWYVVDPEGAYVPKERRTIQAEPHVTTSFEPYLTQVGKLVGSSKDAPRLADCARLLQDRLGEGASAKLSQPYYLDVTPWAATKGHAVTRIAATLGVPLSRVAVIGDMANDMPMFDVAGLTIAMGNGIEALKRRAHFTTETNENEGFAVAMDRYILSRA